MSDREFLLTDEQMRKFVSEGFLLLNTDFPQEFHDGLLEKLNDVYQNEGNPGNNILPRIPELQKVFDHPAVTGALTSVLGCGYMMHPHRHGHFNKVSDPGGWHKDSYWGHSKIRNHHSWWAMIFYFPQECTIDMGPTGVMPGSQNHQSRYFESDETAEEVKAAGRAGTFALVHYDIWHRSNANLAGKDRYMLKFQFVRTQAPAQPEWNCEDEEWRNPAAFTTSLPSQQVQWREAWDWLTGKINGSPAQQAAVGDDAQTAEWLAGLGSEERNIRVKSADELSLRVNSDSSDAVLSALENALQDEWEPVALNASYGLARAGQRGVEALMRGLNSGSKPLIRLSGYGLAAAGPAAVQPLAEALQSFNPDTAAHAVFALGELRHYSEEVLPNILALLSHSSELVRRSAVEALGLIDIPSQPVIAGLCSSLRDSDSQVRFTAGLSIARLGADAEEAVDSLVESLKDEDRYVRANAMEALYRIGTEKAKEVLLSVLRTSRWCAATTKASTF